jgi:hypothetical protein
LFYLCLLAIFSLAPYSVKEEEEQAEKLGKCKTKQLRAAAALYKKQLATAAKVAQEVTKKVRDAEKAERLVVARAQKQQERNAANTQKSLQLFQRGKRAVSQKAVQKLSMRVVQW